MSLTDNAALDAWLAMTLDLPGARHEPMFESPPVAERFLSAAVGLFRG